MLHTAFAGGFSCQIPYYMQNPVLVANFHNMYTMFWGRPPAKSRTTCQIPYYIQDFLQQVHLPNPLLHAKSHTTYKFVLGCPPAKIPYYMPNPILYTRFLGAGPPATSRTTCQIPYYVQDFLGGPLAKSHTTCQIPDDIQDFGECPPGQIPYYMPNPIRIFWGRSTCQIPYYRPSPILYTGFWRGCPPVTSRTTCPIA